MKPRSIAWAALFGTGLLVTSAVTAADKDPEGKQVFLKNRCNSCHTIKAQNVAKKAEATTQEHKKKAPDLSGVGKEHDAAWITGFVLRKELREGEKHPKKFNGSEDDLETIAAWLASLKTPIAEDAEKK